MTSNTFTRRSFLSALGIGAAAIVVPELVLEPRRRFWQVGRNAPVGERFRRVGSTDITFDADAPAFVFYQSDGVEHPLHYADAWDFSEHNGTLFNVNADRPRPPWNGDSMVFDEAHLFDPRPARLLEHKSELQILMEGQAGQDSLFSTALERHREEMARHIEHAYRDLILFGHADITVDGVTARIVSNDSGFDTLEAALLALPGSEKREGDAIG